MPFDPLTDAEIPPPPLPCPWCGQPVERPAIMAGPVQRRCRCGAAGPWAATLALATERWDMVVRAMTRESALLTADLAVADRQARALRTHLRQVLMFYHAPGPEALSLMTGYEWQVLRKAWELVEGDSPDEP